MMESNSVQEHRELGNPPLQGLREQCHVKAPSTLPSSYYSPCPEAARPIPFGERSAVHKAQVPPSPGKLVHSPNQGNSICAFFAHLRMDGRTDRQKASHRLPVGKTIGQTLPGRHLPPSWLCLSA